jgi:coenzyme F420-reducing hydrogenase alpha subunit
MFCYLKQLYTGAHSGLPADPNGRGFPLLAEAMGSSKLMDTLRGFITMQTMIVRLVREIVERVEDEEQDDTVIPAMYIRNSKEIHQLLTDIIGTTGSEGRIYGNNDTVNEFKEELLELFSDNYMYHVERNFLIAAISTITTTQASQLQDHSMNIVSTLLLLV